MELIIPTECGDQTTLEYSRIGRTYIMKYEGFNTYFIISTKKAT